MTRKFGGLLIVLLVLGILANSVGLTRWSSPNGRYWVWVITTILSIGAVATIGSAVSGRPAGLVIDNRNMMSLAKLQMLIWTLVVFPALITGAAANVVGIGAELASTGPLDINIPNELLAALGIAGGSLAAAPVILNTKATSTPHPDEITDTSRQLNLSASQVDPIGKVFAKTFRSDASWADLFRGDEVGNADSTDLGKVQQFFVTLLLAGVYIAAIAALFKEDGAIQAFPPLSEKFIWLLAVSHGTYLATKAAPHTKDAPAGTAPFDTQRPPASPAQLAAPTGASIVRVRLAVADPASTQALTISVDNAPVSIPADGQMDVALEVGHLHTISGRGMRNGQQVQGQVQITPSLNDEQKPLLLTLA